MKLNNKILVGNLVLSVVIFLVTSIGMYYLVSDTVYEELDHHLSQHKIDIMKQVRDDPASISEIMKLGGLGSYEWVDIYPHEGSDPLSTDSFETIDTVRNAAQSGISQTYRRLTTSIAVNDQYYILKIYEEVAGWENISMTILISVLAGLFIWILLLYIVNQFVFDRILTPFYDTVDELERISDPSHFEKSFPDSSTYEINVLNRALNTMMKQIRSSFEDQKKFIQNASHELLTPLSIIRQKAEKILSRSDVLDRNTVEAANEIQQTAVRLSRLSNALLLISRVENKQYALDQEVNIEKVTNEVLEELFDFTEMKDITLQKQFDSSIVVKGNKELIHSAIYNIVQNAIKFSPDHSTVTISIDGDPKAHRFSVRDQGLGIPEELVSSVFDRFKKGNNSRLESDQSPGLGLSIVKSICQLHDFHCYARNQEIGGTEIAIEF